MLFNCVFLGEYEYSYASQTSPLKTEHCFSEVHSVPHEPSNSVTKQFEAYNEASTLEKISLKSSSDE